jgi:hypothetical protein
MGSEQATGRRIELLLGRLDLHRTMVEMIDEQMAAASIPTARSIAIKAGAAAKERLRFVWELLPAGRPACVVFEVDLSGKAIVYRVRATDRPGEYSSINADDAIANLAETLRRVFPEMMQ